MVFYSQMTNMYYLKARYKNILNPATNNFYKNQIIHKLKILTYYN